METLPPPDPARWRGIADPGERLRAGLLELYAYYRQAGPGLVVLIRDAPLLPPEVHRLPSVGDVLRTVPAALMEGWPVDESRRHLLIAAVVHATSVATWQSLVAERGLSDDDAVGLLCCLVRCAADVPSP